MTHFRVNQGRPAFPKESPMQKVGDGEFAAFLGKVAIVIGASRGIGREICVTFAKAGFHVVVCAKSVNDTEKLPGNIYAVSKECEHYGSECLSIPCDVRNEKDIDNVIQQTIAKFNKIDVLIYNAGSIMWDKVINTPIKKFDLMQSVNVRGSYLCVSKVLPHMLANKQGSIILVSPPIYSRFFKGKTPYAIGKVGMSVLTKGLANELEGTGVAINSLWPATAIKSQVTVNFNLGNESVWRKPEIFADACLLLSSDDPNKVNGCTLIDEDYLRTKGIDNFEFYRCLPEVEPPRMMPVKFPSLAVEEEAVFAKL